MRLGLCHRQRCDLHPRIVEACASAQIRQRVGNERGASGVVGDAAAPQPFREADRAAPDRRKDLQRAVHIAEVVLPEPPFGLMTIVVWVLMPVSSPTASVLRSPGLRY